MNNFKNKIDSIQSLHCQLSNIIIEEINTCKLKSNPSMEIIYQSNPTLIPMKSNNINGNSIVTPNSNKHLVENINKKKYDIHTLNPINVKDYNSNDNNNGIKMINQYSITTTPLDALDERKRNKEKYYILSNIYA